MHALPRLRLLLPVVAAVVCPACAVLAPTADPTRHYLLECIRTSRLASRPALVVLVGPVTIPGYLDRKQIVTAGPRHDLELAEFHVWAEDLDRAVARVVAGNLSHLLDSPGVAPFPAVDPPRHDFKAAIVVRRFEMAADRRVRLEAGYILSAPREAGLAPRTASRSITVRVADPADHSAIADAMSRALSDLSRAIGRAILDLERRRDQTTRDP